MAQGASARQKTRGSSWAAVSMLIKEIRDLRMARRTDRCKTVSGV